MEEIKEKPNLIERGWWLIPPAFIIFVYWPLIRWILDGTYSLDNWLRDLNSFLVMGDSGLYAIFMFGFIGIGYLLTIKRSLKIRIIIPSVLGAVGHWVGFLLAMGMSSSM